MHIVTSFYKFIHRRKLHLSYYQYKNFWGIIFVIPGLLFFLLFFLYPIIKAFWISLHKWNIIQPAEFIGLNNYIELFTKGSFMNSLNVTLYFVIGSIIPVLLLAFLSALLFNRTFRGRNIFLGIWYIPAIVPLVVVATLWKIMYNPSFGLLTIITEAFGIYNLAWLTSPSLAMPAIIILNIWRSFPYYMVIILAGLGSIPSELYESAHMDGANGFQSLVYITIPLIKRILLYVSIIAFINIFQTFSLPYLMTQGGPGSATRLLPFYVYQNAFQKLRMGYASSASLVMFSVLLVVTVIQFRISRIGGNKNE